MRLSVQFHIIATKITHDSIFKQVKKYFYKLSFFTFKNIYITFLKSLIIFTFIVCNIHIYDLQILKKYIYL